MRDILLSTSLRLLGINHETMGKGKGEGKQKAAAIRDTRRLEQRHQQRNTKKKRREQRKRKEKKEDVEIKSEMEGIVFEKSNGVYWDIMRSGGSYGF